LNKFFKKWILEAVEEMDETFTVHQIVSNIVEKKGTSMYVGNSQEVGSLLSSLPKLVERLGDGKYRRLDI
tara:strand:+ start:1365 stop:1574 length:210 start_codon:yes stop_codon:yes gene_type:complete